MKVFRMPSSTWLEIVSELFVELAGALLIIVFIEPIYSPVKTVEDLVVLTTKGLLGILFLVLAKKLREDSKR